MGEDQSAADDCNALQPQLPSLTDRQVQAGHIDTKNENPKPRHRSVRQRWATMSLPNKLMAVATIFIALATVVNVCIAYAQWTEMDESGAQTSRLIHLYRWQLVKLGQQASDTHELAVQAKHQADTTLSQATATNELAKQAKRSADTAAHTFVAAQRPYIGISTLTPTAVRESPSASSGNLKITAEVKNFGPVPGTNFILDWEIFVAGELQESINPAPARGIIFPGQSVYLHATIGKHDYESVVNGTKTLDIEVTVSYDGPSDHYKSCQKQRFDTFSGGFADLGIQCSR